MTRADVYMPRILRHEGGFVDHPDDPGGATNRGVTIGTLKRLGIDKDGDGDSDIADLRALTEADAARVFKRFYADPVQADLLPPGVDFAVVDFAVNSGPSRAAQHLQRALGVTADGHVGPKTIAAAAKANPAAVIDAICDSRLKFLRGLKTWKSFGKGWTRRVAEVRSEALADNLAAQKGPSRVTIPAIARPPLLLIAKNLPVEDIVGDWGKPAPQEPAKPATGLLARILSALVAWLGRK